MTQDEFKYLQPWQLEELADTERVLGRTLTAEDMEKIAWTSFGLGELAGIKVRPTVWLQDELGEEYARRCELLRAQREPTT